MGLSVIVRDSRARSQESALGISEHMVRERVFERLESEVARLKRQLGTWADSDNDGVAELQKQHADFQGGEARNVGAVIIDGTPVLTANGKVSTAALPDLAITETNVVADESERLNLDAEEGDVAIQQDVEKSYILVTNDPTQTSNWAELSSTPAQWQEDGSGNLIPVDGETIGDGTTTANHKSVSTEELLFDQLSKGTLIELWQADVDSDTEASGILKYTESVAQTDTTIHSLSPNRADGGTVTIVGRDGNGNEFTEMVSYTILGSASVISGSTTTRNSPASRTYTVSTRDLQLSVASGSYEIAAYGPSLHNAV